MHVVKIYFIYVIMMFIVIRVGEMLYKDLLSEYVYRGHC